MTELEKDIERKLKDLVEDLGGKCLKWTCPGWRGVPDRIVLMPRGRVYFVELKRPKGGKLSEMQKWWHKQLRKLGFWVLCVYNEDDIKTFELLIKTGKSDIF